MSTRLSNNSTITAHADASRLLQLPTAALDLVLQQLDLRSFVSLSESCRKLRAAVLANVRDLVVTCSTPEALINFNYRKLLRELTQCSLTGDGQHLDFLGPCHSFRSRCLRQLHLRRVRLEDDAFEHCPSLTALHLQECVLQEGSELEQLAASAPHLQHLVIEGCRSLENTLPVSGLEQLTQLTSLSLGLKPLFDHSSYVPADFGQEVFEYQLELGDCLSELVSLQHLKLTDLFCDGLPGGFPSSLTNLTSLEVQYKDCRNYVEQFQHLSSLTALQQLNFASDEIGVEISSLHGIQHLSQLTSLDLECYGMEFDTANTSSWAQLTALQRLALARIKVHPAALAALTQLSTLSLRYVRTVVNPPDNRPLQHLLAAVSQLTRLTELCLLAWNDSFGVAVDPPEAAAFTALTASSNLCSLRLHFYREDMPQQWALFKPGIVLPHLRHIDLQNEILWAMVALPQAVALNNEQLQRLCSSCPAVESLVFAVLHHPAATACAPLLQLSALTRLTVHKVSSATAAVVKVAAQLTRLKQLALWDLPSVTDIALLKLTALTALEDLELRSRVNPVHLQCTESCATPVHIQLLCHLLPDALHKCSSGAAAVPAGPDLAQLAATLQGLAAKLSGLSMSQ